MQLLEKLILWIMAVAKNVSSLGLICQLLNHNYIFFKAISSRALTVILCEATNFFCAFYKEKKYLSDVSGFFPPI